MVVTFNPNLEDLSRCLQAVSGEVDRIALVDNGSTNREALHELLQLNAWPVEFIGLEQNNGIASALNVGLSRALDAGAVSALLLDQDSVVMPSTVERLRSHCMNGVALCAPRISDRNNDNITQTYNAGVSDVNYCINSGSLLLIDAWQTVSGYDEGMFIDFVDFDFCLRLRLAGYRIVKDDSVVLSHTIGQQSRHGGVVAYNHSAFRLRHMARDMLYYAAKHRNSPQDLRVARRSTGGTLLVIAKKVAVVIIFESSKLEKTAALLSGTWSGLKRHGWGRARGGFVA
ncbi:glycosyltransferase [Williamsia deligens]